MNNKTPKLRFKGFTDAWEQRKLDDICKNITDGSHFSPTEVADGYPMPSVKDMTESGFDYQTSKKISKEDFNILVKQGCKPEIGDVLVAKDGSILKYAFEVKEKQEVVVLSSIAIFKPKKAIIDGGFLAQYFKIEEFKRRVINENTTGTGVPRIVLANFKKFEISFPGIEEQKQISKFLEKIDNLITLHQRKLDKLKSLKKAYLEKMFPKKGKLYPELRFAGFTDAWEQRKLSNVVDVGSGRDYKHLHEGNIPVYGTGGYMLSVSEALSEKDDAIGIGRKGTIDNPFILRAPFWTVDTLFYCVPKDNYDLNFTYCIFQNVNWKSKDESTGVPSLSKTTINNIDVMVPTLPEQKKIGDYFSTIDNLITLHQRKLEKLKQLKTGYLNSMFI